MERRTLLKLAAVSAAGAAIKTGPAFAAVDLAGENIEWIIPFSNGGGSDTWARFNAPFLSKYLPGNPTVVVRNEPGGGSTKGTNLFAARARPDGLTILGTSGSTQFPYLLGDPRVQYEYKDWEIVLAAPTGGVAYVSPSLGLSSAADLAMLRDQRLVYANQGATSLDLVPLLGFRLMGLEVQHVFGFKGRGDGRLAFERGETNIDYQTSSAYLKNVQPLVDEGLAVPLFSWGALDGSGNIVRDPTFPDLPHYAEAYEMMTGSAPSGEMWDAWVAFFTAGFAAQKMIFLPEGTSADIVEAYRGAVRQMIEDPEYLAAKTAVLGTYNQVTDGAAEALFNRAVNVSDSAKSAVVDMLKAEYNVSLGD